MFIQTTTFIYYARYASNKYWQRIHSGSDKSDNANNDYKSYTKTNIAHRYYLGSKLKFKLTSSSPSLSSCSSECFSGWRTNVCVASPWKYVDANFINLSSKRPSSSMGEDRRVYVSWRLSCWIAVSRRPSAISYHAVSSYYWICQLLRFATVLLELMKRQYVSLLCGPLYRGRNKRCIRLPVCLSVRPVPPIFLKQESHRNFKFSGDVTLNKSN